MMGVMVMVKKTNEVPEGFVQVGAMRVDWESGEEVWEEQAFLAKWDPETESYVKVISDKFLDVRDREAMQVQEVANIDESKHLEHSQKFIGRYECDQDFGYVIASSIDKDRIFVEEQKFLESQENAAIPALYEEIISKVPLTDKQKEFVQAYIKGNSLSEIAEQMGISKGGAQKHSQFVMKKLKKFFKR